MTLRFLEMDAQDGVRPRSPLGSVAEAAGGALETVDGWIVAGSFGSPDLEREACATAVGFADASHVGVLELHRQPEGLTGIATRDRGAWWCQVTPARTLAICDPGETGLIREGLREECEARVVDLTAGFAGLWVVGPLARETFARFCALDLRDASLPVGGFMPGSVARTPGLILREDEDRFLMLFGAAYAEYMWTVVSDAAGRLGGRPVGLRTLRVEEPAGA